MNITQDELLDALSKAMEKKGDGEGATLLEIQASSGYGCDKVRRLMRVLASEGRLEIVKKPRVSLDGRPILVPAYRIKAK